MSSGSPYGNWRPSSNNKMENIAMLIFFGLIVGWVIELIF